MEIKQGMVTIKNEGYPKLLKKIGRDAPDTLYYKGDISLLGSDCLAVVGSRRMTTYGSQIVEKIVSRVVAAGITIVSGFMYGMDAAAHKAAVDAGGLTIAVMPCGIDLVHPEYQVKLYDEVLRSGGLVISEYEGKTQPGYWTYPARNRIVAGISKAVLVVEAAEKSGSLITANLAVKFGRKLFAVPGPATSVVSEGTNGLIKAGKAEMVLVAEDILKFFNKKQKVCARPGLTQKNQGLEGRILEQLQSEPMEIDFLSRKLGENAATLGTTLSLMQIKGQIKNMKGKYHVS